MKIRYGVYTFYNGIEMNVSDFYGHGLDQELELTHRILSYPMALGKTDGFVLDGNSGLYKMEVLLNELTNAFFVVTKAKYKGNEFVIEPYDGDKIHFHLATKNLELGKDLGFVTLHDSFGEPYCLGEVEKNDLEEVWEERSPGVLNKPFPDEIERLKLITVF